MEATGYSDDLAYVHHVGFEGFAERAAPWILGGLRRAGLRRGTVVDLGCGSGAFAARATAAGHRVVGIDVSPSMLAIARRRAPRATFRRGSFADAALPRCDAVVALGEVLGYRFDRRAGRPALRRLFRRVFDALAPGGMFVFDVAGPGRATVEGANVRVVRGDDWVVLVRRREGRGRLVREIATFRREGRGWRGTEETHVLVLFRPDQVLDDLAAAGFVGAQVAGFGRERFPAGLAGFVALKPPSADARPAPRRGPRAAAGRATDGGGRASRSRRSTSARVRGARR
ncbi:MAG: class I SAM-dependent methyltransferase [Planctomycetia bacterium]|nr:class I SAM-dependent methyltransferase [Planctomycetia bacterium]